LKDLNLSSTENKVLGSKMGHWPRNFILSITVATLLITSGFQKKSRDSLNAAPPAKTPKATDIKEDIQAKVNEYMNVCLKFDLFGSSGPGFSVLIAAKGQILVSKGYGFANCEHDVLNIQQTKFRLGSLSKQFTAMGIMQLQEKGLLKITDSINKYIPDYPQGDKITIHHLLTHTSGIYPFLRYPDYETYKTLPSSLEALIERLKNNPPEFSPGTRFSYCSSGYIVLSYIIEKVSEQPCEEFLKENIFDRIGMKNTGYDNHEQVIKKMAAGYRSDSEGGHLINGPYVDPFVFSGSGAMYSTVEDLYIWERSLYTERLVSSDSLKKIFTPYKGNYGYGWFVGSENGKNLALHRGKISGFTGQLSRYLDDEICIIVLSNFEYAPVIAIGKRLAAIVYGEDVKSVIAEHIMGEHSVMPLGIRLH